MDYERENAKEWQFDPASRPGPGTSGSDGSDEEYDEYLDAVIPVDTNQEDDGLGWERVTYNKKPPPKPTPKQMARPIGNVPSGPAKAPAPVRKTPLKPPGKLQPKPHATPLPKLPPTLPPAHPQILPLTVLSTFPNRQKISLSQKPPVLTFAHKNDNPARAAFRAQKTHTGTFVLTKHCYSIEPDRERMYNTLEEMGVRLGSFIRPPQSAGDRNLLLWGNEDQVSATIGELEKWVQQSDQRNYASHTSKKGHQFAKTGLLSQDNAKKLNRWMKIQATKQKYQKVPDTNLSFQFTGYFLWPVDEIRPEDLLGPSYEAFDPIRIDYDSYIVFDNQYSLFKILTNAENAVQEAMKRIEGTMKEFVARTCQETVVHMVERPDPQLMRREVMLMEGPSLGQSTSKAMIPLLTGEPLAPAQIIQWKREMKVAEEYQFAQWRHLIGKVVKRLHVYRGRIQMRVLLGTFALTTFRRLPDGVDSILFEKFLKDMDLPATKGRMIKDLQEKESSEVLLSHICKATKIFAPVDALTTKLEDVRPVYTARFEFDIPSIGKVKLEIEGSRPISSDNRYEITQSQWTKKTEKVDAVHPLKVFMIRLLGGISWELQVTTSQALDASRITPTMIAFADNIRFKVLAKSIKDAISGEKVFGWDPSPLLISSFEQKTSLRYRIVDNSDWMFEFARYDQFGGTNPDVPTSTSWGASFWNSEWDRTLGTNAALKIGEAPKWDPQLDTFFPSSRRTSSDSREAAGLREFLGNTKAIVELLDGIQS